MFKKIVSEKVSRWLTYSFIAALVYPISAAVVPSLIPQASAGSITTKAYPWAFSDTQTVGSAAPSGWTSAGAADNDDNGYTVLNTSWSVNFNGVTYNRVDVSSNSFITFWNSTSTQPNSAVIPTRGTAATSPAAPTIHLCSGDRRAWRIFYKLGTDVNGKGTLQIRWEGYSYYSSGYTSGTPQTIWEATLYQDSSIINLGVGINGGCSDTNRLPSTGITDGTKFIQYFSSAITDSVGGTPPVGYEINSSALSVSNSRGTSVATNVGVTIFDTITVTGNIGTTRITMNTANDGVTFDTSTGVAIVRISRNTTASFSQTFTATDSTGASSSLTVNYTINALPTNTVSRSTLTTTLGRTGSETMTVSGGSGTKTFTKTSSFPQSGITIDTSSAASGIAVLKVAATGVVAGTTTETITCTDAVGSVTIAVFTVTVNSVLSLVNSRGYTVPVTVGRASVETITVTGGTSPFTYALSGTVTSGTISIDTSTSASGYILLKTTNLLAAGTYYETVTVTDSKTASSTLGMKVVATAVMVIGGGATSTFSASSGVDSYDTLTVTGGSLPNSFTVASTPSTAGISISSSSNTQVVVKIASTVAAGSYSIVVTGTDTASATTFHTISATVSSPLRWSNSNSSTLATTLGNAKNLQLDFVNGGSGKTFTMAQSALMTNPGITLDTTTILSNYVTLKVARTVGPGTYSVTVTGRDATGTQISSVITVTVNQPLSMTRNYNLLAIGLGSQKFNGTGQHLALPAGDRWALGGTWTMEWWQYETGTATEKSVIKMAGNAFGVGMTATSLYLYNNSTYTTLTSSLVEADRKNKWTHFAIVSDSGTVYAYQNGIRLNATGINFGAVTTTYAPNTYAVCIGTKCGATDGTTASSTNYFGGYIANLMINKRIDYTGTSTTDANFTPGYNINIDSRTVTALVLLPGDSVLTDLSNSALTVTQRGNTAVGATDFPNMISPDVMVLETTQGKARVTYSFNAEGGTGNKTMTSSADTVGLVTNLGYPGVLFHNLNESATAINSTTVRSVYETVTATDASGAVLQAKSKIIVNPQVAISATSFNLSVAAGVQAFDTITALYGTGSKSISLVSSPATSAIDVFSSVPGTNATLVLRVTKNATVGTYYETLTATDWMGDSETAVVTITVTPGLSLSSATGSTSISATAGKATTLRIDAANGSGNKTFTLTETGRSSSGAIYLNNTNANTGNGYTLLTIADTVTAGYTYSEKITVTDANGSTADITISVTVNSPQTITYKGATSGAIAIATTAGKAFTSDAFTAALGTGARTLSISNTVTGVSIDTSTASVGYLTLGASMNAGTYTETVTATDEAGATTKRTVTITVNPAISLSATSLSLTTTTGVAITDTVTATSGTGTKTFSLAVSPVVSGITFTNAVTDRAVITVGNTVGPGTYTITLTATDSVSATSSVNISLTVNSSISITGPTALTMTTGYLTYTNFFTVANGTGSISLAVIDAPVSNKVSIETSTATTFRLKILQDIATTNSTTPKTYYETITATDSLGAKGYAYLTLTVNPQVSLDGNKTLSKVYGEELTQVYQTNSGTSPFRFFASNVCTSEKITDGSYTVEKFEGTGTCDWNVPTGVSSVSVLTVAGGGGGGGSAWAGGGGAGGVVYASTYSVTEKQSISVVVGTGGNGGTNDTTCTSGSSPSQGSNGGNSSFNSTFTAIGGGGGGGYGWSGRTGCGSGKQGGSGGGSGETDYTPTTATSTQGTFAGATSYGNSGGRTTWTGGIQAGSGGGGAGAVGGSTNGSQQDHVAGNGGNGIANSITGSSITYAGGGGGATCSGCTPSPTYGSGGTGGGGAGGYNAAAPGNGINGLGGGGGGSQTGTGGKGGTGAVIVRYLTPTPDTSTTFLTMTTLSTGSTGTIQLNAPRNLPVLPNNGTYVQTVTVTDSTGSTGATPVTITLSVTRATPNISLSIPGGGTTAIYGSPVSLTANSSVAGTFSFRKGGSTISGCDLKSTSNGQATCSWTPTDTSTVVMTAEFVPSDLTNYSSVKSSNLTLTVLQAETLTVTFNAQTLTYTGSAASISRAYTLSGLSSIDSITAVATTITGTANDSSPYSNTTSPTNAGTYSLTGTGVTFSGSTKASYYKGISFVPGAITINRAGNAITLNYGTSNTITYKPSGTETATATFLGDGSKNFESTNTSLCTVNSTTGALTTVQAGFCDVRLGISQSTNYLGDTITATVQIKRAARTISISSAAASLKYGETTTVATTVNYAALDGLISYTNGTSTGCSYDSTANILTAISGTATCSLNAFIGIGTNYDSATSTSISVTLSKANAPVITLTAPANVNYSPTATSSDMAKPTFTITGLKLNDTSTALTDMTITYVSTGTYAYNSTTVPTGANVYTLTPSALILSTGDIGNYQTPTYVGANWTINRIAQAALRATSLLQEGITVPYDVQYAGGTTNGQVTLTISAGGTASGCSTSGLNLRATSSGTCVIQLSMAGNQNYLDVSSETITVVIANFVQYIFNFDSLASGSTGITITSEVPIVKDLPQCADDCVPTISSISTTTFQAGDQLVITGVDFASATEVIFNRNKFVLKDDGMSVNSNTQITVVVPTGLTVGSGTGSISVKSGVKVSPRLTGLTITG